MRNKEQIYQELIYIKKNLDPSIWSLIEYAFTEGDFCVDAFGFPVNKCTDDCNNCCNQALKTIKDRVERM